MHPTFIITTFTGDPASSVIASVLSVPTAEHNWSDRLKVYFKALTQFHARARETALGTLMVTNLSAFPSSLTVIPVPEGDTKKYREYFFVNENLKRLGCSGRVGLTLTTPSSATQAKFHQLYRTSDKIPLFGAVIELVKLCQVALMLFGCLQPEYADGLLCDLTEQAINDWWVEFGTDYYNMEPHDGILGPTTVAALLGMLMGARNRLHAVGAPIGKDVFDVDSAKRAISHFQKSQRLVRTRRLDRNTWEKLQRATAKAASGEGWNVARGVKSRVAELGGKGGEMVMETFGVKEKAGISDIETVDIERFIPLVKGERAKWLWYGKPRKNTGDMFSRLPENDNLVLQQDDNGGFIWSGRQKDTGVEDGAGSLRRKDTTEDMSRFPLEEDEDNEDKDARLRKRTTLKGIDEAGRRGLGRIKDAVGRRGHHSKPSRDERMQGTSWHIRGNSENNIPGPLSQPGSPDDLKRPHEENALNDDLIPEDSDLPPPVFAKVISETPVESRTSLSRMKDSERLTSHETSTYWQHVTGSKTSGGPSTAPSLFENSLVDPLYRDLDLDELLPVDGLPGKDTGALLRRTQSTSVLQTMPFQQRSENWWPRRLSFSIAEESILTWQRVTWSIDDDPILMLDPKSHLRKELYIAEETRDLRSRVAALSFGLARDATTAVRTIRNLEKRGQLDQHELDNLYYPALEAFQGLQELAHESVEGETVKLRDKLREIEAMGARLEYEINALRGKVEDVEDGVGELERQVEFLEERAAELEDENKNKASWTSRLVSVLFGMKTKELAEIENDGQEANAD